MSSIKHKEISDKLRELLRELDDDRLTKTGKLILPEKVTTTKSFSSKKEPSLRQLNAKVLSKRILSREEREAEAKRLAKASRPQYPDARCIFVQHTECIGCGHLSEGMSHPDIFLRLRRLQGTSFHPTDIQYVRERDFVEYPGTRLPRLIIHHTSKVQRCHKCFTNAGHCFPEQDTGSQQQNPSHLPASISRPSSDESSSPEISTSSKSATAEEGKSGTPTFPSSGNSLPSEEQSNESLEKSLPSGSDFTSSVSGNLTPAAAKRTIIPTGEAQVPALLPQEEEPSPMLPQEAEKSPTMSEISDAHA